MTPRYKLRPDSGELQEYLFEYNGILALKNFVARVDGERLILHSAADMNFSILDALVSEVEIDGRVYDTPEAAQQALQRLTFNTNRPVLMTQRERELLEGALQRGTYVGTAADLKALLNRKVDKVPGKMLSTNDFTNELRTKLEGLRQVDISGLLPKGGYTGTAQNLKELIDNIMRILQSPDTELDELREIVAYIKQNKRVLDTLGISNIAGLQDALNGKAPTDHHHDDRYSRLGHTHSEYAYRTHRHHWDDIDGKPAFNYLPLTGGNINGELSFNDNIKVVARPDGSSIAFGNKPFDALVYGEFKGIKLWGNDSNDKVVLAGGGVKHKDEFFTNRDYDFGLHISSINTFKNLPNGIHCVGVPGEGGCLAVFRTNSSASSIYLLAPTYKNHRLMYNWTIDNNRYGSTFKELAYFEDVHRVGIERYNWTATKDQQNNVIFVTTSGFIELDQIEHLGSMSFRKVFAGGQVTFTCAGKTIIYTGDNSFNGGDGSTAVVSVYGNKCYIDIRNV